MKITQDQNGAITITFNIDEIEQVMNFNQDFELQSPKPTFNDGLKNFRGRTVELLKKLRTHYGIDVLISRTDKVVNDLIWESRIKDLAQVLRELESRGVVTVNRSGEGHGSIRIVDFKFNY
jgi:hypothetical protein